MYAPIETAVGFIALAYSSWEAYDLVVNLGPSFNELFTAWVTEAESELKRGCPIPTTMQVY